MKRWLLALAVLLGCAVGMASADYVIIIASLNESIEPPPDPTQQQPTGPGGMGMLGGPMPGMAGGRPGGGMTGVPPMPPGGMAGARGGPGMGGAGMGGAGMYGAMGGRPGMGQLGMYGNMGAGGRPGGMYGMYGNMGMRGMGGGMGMVGMAGGTPGGSVETDFDEDPYHVVAVVEIAPLKKNAQKWADMMEKYGRTSVIKVKHKWGQTNLIMKAQGLKVIFPRGGDGKPMATVGKRFETKFAETFGGKPSAEDAVNLAAWALEHGLINQVPRVMDKAAELDKANPAVVAYLKVKADLDRPMGRQTGDNPVRTRLLDGYRADQDAKHHYTVLHKSDVKDVQGPMDRLEDAFRGFYYWFALRGVALPVPRERLMAVLTDKEDEFKRFHRILTAGQVISDGFFARRENVSVVSARRLDGPYNSFLTKTNPLWTGGFNYELLLTGKKLQGYPRDVATNQPLIAMASTLALLRKSMEEEAERTAISHDASRQLVFGAGLLPRNVSTPEWIGFGMGSFFETPLEAPWGGPGSPNFYYLPRFLELKKKALKNPYDTMRLVVTDGFFRHGLPGQDREASLRAGRAASWALAYYLAKTNLTGLQSYFKELSKMPRDLELSEEVLLGCFARAFGAVGADRKPDVNKLNRLARAWYSYMDSERTEVQDVAEEIRAAFKEMRNPGQRGGNGGNGGNGGPQTGPGGVPPGAGGGYRPPGGPGGGVRPPSGPGGGGRKPPRGG